MNSFIKVTIEIYNDTGVKSVPDTKLEREFVHYTNALDYWDKIRNIIINVFNIK